MNGRDLTGDTFAGSGYSTPLSLPYGDVQYLGNNAAFGAIDILDDTLPSGGTLTLNAIGGGSALQLCLPQRLHGGHRGDLNVAADVSVLVEGTLTDSGSLSFGSSDAVTFYGSQISVYGTMTATGDTFTNTGYTSTIQVYAGGELKASSSTFNLSQVAWAENSVLNGSDLTGDTFAGSGYSTPLSLPYGDVQYLGDNAAFGAIDILNDTLPSGGTLTLNVIGGGSALRYVFPTGFTAATGGTINVAAGVSVLVEGTLTDNGSLSFAASDAVTFYGSQISVYGTMTATGDTFTNTGYTSTIQVYAGGELKASSSTFNLSQVALAEGSVLKGRRPCRRLVQRLGVQHAAVAALPGRAVPGRQRGLRRRRHPRRHHTQWRHAEPQCRLREVRLRATSSPADSRCRRGRRSSSGPASTCSSNRL